MVRKCRDLNILVNNMKKILFLILLFSLAGCGASQDLPVQESDLEISKGVSMKIASSVFNQGEAIPAKYTCDGEDISPALSIAEVPEGALSLVLICDDPDAPAGDWVHWLVWNIEPGVGGIAENTVPAGGVEGTTSFGKTDYGGPCPPSRTHRYFFKVYALDTKLDLDSSADKTKLLEAMEGHVLGEAVLMGTYAR